MSNGRMFFETRYLFFWHRLYLIQMQRGLSLILRIAVFFREDQSEGNSASMIFGSAKTLILRLLLLP